MAKLSKTPMSGYDKFNKSVMAIPEWPYDIAFDSVFERSVDSGRNCILRIVLRIFYKQINPAQVTAAMMRGIAASMGVSVPPGVQVGMYPDAGNNFHLVKEWSGLEWTNFINAVKAQANLWDSRFWLVPPDDFSLFDIVEGSWTNKSGSTTTRPNIKCEFNLEISMSHFGAHRLIEVVNLVGPGFFRSHAGLYDSSDTTIKQSSKPDWNSIKVPTNQPVIAHEIGHAIGLPHIGRSRNLAQCGLAMVMDQHFPQASIPALYKGGSNADVCYGTRSSAGDIDDIMGAGSAFNQENAKPWLDRLPQHLNLSVSDYVRLSMGLGRWKVSTTEVPPMSLVTITH